MSLKEYAALFTGSAEKSGKSLKVLINAKTMRACFVFYPQRLKEHSNTAILAVYIFTEILFAKPVIAVENFRTALAAFYIV